VFNAKTIVPLLPQSLFDMLKRKQRLIRNIIPTTGVLVGNRALQVAIPFPLGGRGKESFDYVVEINFVEQPMPLNCSLAEVSKRIALATVCLH
jgi:hypothetical protein